MVAEWTTAELGSVTDLLTGFPFKSNQYVDDPNAIRLLRGDNIAQGVLRWNGEKRWPHDAVEDSSPYWLEEGDVVLAMDRPWIDAGLKYAAIRKSDLPVLLVQRVARLRGTKILETSFLKYVIGSRSFTDYVLAVQTGTAVPHISSGQIREYEFAVPPLPEQRAIAHILSALDNKIELNRQMTATLEAVAQALFKAFFVDFEPVHAKAEGQDPGLSPRLAALFLHPLVEAEKGEIPAGWQTWPLDQIATQHRTTLSPGLEPDRQFEHYSIPAHDAKQEPALDAGASIKSNKTIVPDGAVLLSKLNPEICRVWLPKPKGGAPQIASTEFLCFTPKEPAGRALLYCLFKNADFRTEMEAMVTGTSKIHQRISASALLRLDVIVGSDEVFRAFEAKAWPVLDRVLSCREESRALAALRDTLLPKLISGELRVKDAETFLYKVL